jgi:hypothetical protein
MNSNVQAKRDASPSTQSMSSKFLFHISRRVFMSSVTFFFMKNLLMITRKRSWRTNQQIKIRCEGSWSTWTTYEYIISACLEVYRFGIWRPIRDVVKLFLEIKDETKGAIEFEVDWCLVNIAEQGRTFNNEPSESNEVSLETLESVNFSSFSSCHILRAPHTRSISRSQKKWNDLYPSNFNDYVKGDFERQGRMFGD